MERILNKPVRIIFSGTPDFSAPYLQGLLDDPDFLVLGVLTQPDKPSGREQKLSPSPIKLLAQKNNLQIWQPEKLRQDGQIVSELKETGADLLVVVAYGQIIPKNILDLFPRGAINVHPSLLPKYRGASPIQSALLAGEKETGISIMLVDEKMDHGPILAQERIQLAGEETNESLHQQLAVGGVSLLISTIKKYLTGEIKPKEQDHEAATFCATITKEHGRIDWSQPAQAIKQKIYAFCPWPATWTTLDNKRLKIFPPAEVIKTKIQENKNTREGKILIENDKMSIVCGGDDCLQIKKIQLEGKKESSVADFIRGRNNLEGKKFE